MRPTAPSTLFGLFALSVVSSPTLAAPASPLLSRSNSASNSPSLPSPPIFESTGSGNFEVYRARSELSASMDRVATGTHGSGHSIAVANMGGVVDGVGKTKGQGDVERVPTQEEMEAGMKGAREEMMNGGELRKRQKSRTTFDEMDPLMSGSERMHKRQLGTVDSSKSGNIGVLNEECVQCDGAPNDQNTNVGGLGISTAKTGDSRVADKQITPLSPSDPDGANDSALNGLGLDMFALATGGGERTDADATDGGMMPSSIAAAMDSILASIGGKQIGGDDGGIGRGLLKLSFLPYQVPANSIPAGTIACPSTTLSLSSFATPPSSIDTSSTADPTFSANRRSLSGPTFSPGGASPILSDTSSHMSALTSDPQGTTLVALCFDVAAADYRIPGGSNVCPEDRKAFLDVQMDSKKEGVFHLCEALEVLP